MKYLFPLIREPQASRSLYLGVNHATKNFGESWFKANAMGVNSLMETTAEKDGLDNSHLTNHSA